MIDLPIAREKATGIPFLPGSSLKGALRTQCTTNPETEHYCNEIFGPSDILSEERNSASQAQFTDQRLLLLPVRSLAGTFAWVTSPYILQRFRREVLDIQGSVSVGQAVPEFLEEDICYVSVAQSAIVLKDLKSADRVFLEDLNLKPKAHPFVKEWAEWIGPQLFAEEDVDAGYWRKQFTQRLCLVSDTVFNFLLETATEIITRIRLEENTKTVTDGGLWYEEALPTETVLTGMLVATPVKEGKLSIEEIFAILKKLTGAPIQLGGKATVGCGICRVHLV